MAIDFYFSDLTSEAQQRFLKAQGLSCAQDGNYDMDILPVFTLETDDDCFDFSTPVSESEKAIHWVLSGIRREIEKRPTTQKQ